MYMYLYLRYISKVSSPTLVIQHEQLFSYFGLEVEELRIEIQYLWDEEEEQGLAEVAEDGDDRQRHPAEVTKRVAWKSEF